MHAGVLAQIVSPVEAEGVDACQRAVHQEQAGMRAPIGAQAVGDEGNIAADLRRALIAVGPASSVLRRRAEICPNRAR
jgi:hypothetical protein